MKVVIAQQNAEHFDAVRQVVLGLGMDCGPRDCVAFADLSARLSPGPVDLVLVRAGSDGASAREVIREAVRLTRAPVLAFGPVTDARQILEITHGGAREYLDEGRLREELERFLEQLRDANEADFGSGVVFSVTSPTPGAGVTTLATNLAFVWGRTAPHRVVLAELGRDPAELAGRLGLELIHGAVDVCGSGERLDGVLIRQALSYAKEDSTGVGVLAHMPETFAPEAIDPAAMRRLLVLFRSLFAHTVLDLGHSPHEEHFQAMRLSDLVLVVARLDVPALRQTRRFLRELAEQGIARERLRLVANHYGQPGQVSWRDAEEALGVRFLEYVAEDCRRVNQALNNGQPVVTYAPSARVSRQIARLASLLLNQRPASRSEGRAHGPSQLLPANPEFLPPEVPEGAAYVHAPATGS